jgi:hypothetical protein
MVNVLDFQRLDLRVGQICGAEPIKGARRLLKVQVDLGQEQRTLVAGVAAHYATQELLGLTVIVPGDDAGGWLPQWPRDRTSDGQQRGAEWHPGRVIDGKFCFRNLEGKHERGIG